MHGSSASGSKKSSDVCASSSFIALRNKWLRLGYFIGVWIIRIPTHESLHGRQTCYQSCSPDFCLDWLPVLSQTERDIIGAVLGKCLHGTHAHYSDTWVSSWWSLGEWSRYQGRIALFYIQAGVDVVGSLCMKGGTAFATGWRIPGPVYFLLLTDSAKRKLKNCNMVGFLDEVRHDLSLAKAGKRHLQHSIELLSSQEDAHIDEIDFNERAFTCIINLFQRRRRKSEQKLHCCRSQRREQDEELLRTEHNIS